MSGRPVSVIVETLEASGVRFRLDGEKIKAKLPEPSPPEVLEALATLRARRSEVIALLRACPNKSVASRGSPRRAGCYEVEAGKFLHPPRVGAAPVQTEVQRLSPETQTAIRQPCAHCAGQGVCACPACNLRRVSEPVPCLMCETEKRQPWLAATRPTGTSQVLVQ